MFLIIVLLFSVSCVFHGSCKRNQIGKIIISDGSYLLKKVIMLRDEGGGFTYKYVLALKLDGTYSLQLVDPESDCKNDCNQTTVAPQTRITVTDTSQTQIFLDTMFYCSKDYTYSGNDIVLPTLTIN
jgi:hypothetical protein